MDSRRSQNMERLAASATIAIPHLGSIAALLYALRWGVTTEALVSFAVMYVLTMLGITVGFHRLATHRSFQAVPLVRDLLLVLGSMAGQGPPVFWVAAHRRHHEASDQEDDPHSPHARPGGSKSRLLGLVHAHVGWMFAHGGDDISRYARDLLRDRRLLQLNYRYPWWVMLGIVGPAALGFAVQHTAGAALEGALFGGLLRMCLAHHATWCVNSVCHALGAQPYRTRDQSRNSAWVAVLTMGEGWHNNHHAFPSSARHGLEWWQLDVSYLTIRLLTVFGLASEVKCPSARDIERKAEPSSQAKELSP